MNFEKIWIVPSKFPPGKAPVADFETRLSWTKSLFKEPYFEVSELERSATQTLFAKDIYFRLNIENPGSEHYWILGEDQWENLQYWQNVDDYASKLIWLVMSRNLDKRDRKTGIFSRRLLRSSCPYIWAQIKSMPKVSSTQIREDIEANPNKKPEGLPDLIEDEIRGYYASNINKS